MNQDFSLPLSAALRVEDLCTDFEEQYRAGQSPRIEDFLVQIEDSTRRHLLRELLLLEIELRRRAGQTPRADDYRPRFLDHADLVEEVLDETINKSAADQSSELPAPPSEVMLPLPESCGKPAPAPAAPLAAGERIGRYLIERQLGQGGFGQVLLARDEELERHVAIKIPRPDRDFSPEEVTIYLTEARTLASLDHPHIVPVYDVGRTGNGHPYIVSKYVEGSDLGQRMEQSPVTVAEAAGWTATVAEALHYAHKRGMVHRDIKPGNILLDLDGNPHVVDFGLALKETDLGKGPRLAGTVAFMSPEQARGESHRVDGRSDIYSLGAVLYQLLTGRRTFTADNRDELLKLIARQEPKPPRQINDQIPKELERICLKALSRRASDRYTTAKDMAEDLRHFLGDIQGNAVAAWVAVDTQPHPAADSSTPRAGSATVDSDSQPIRIVPKGLRSFDEHDADFFLELLPGPRDREGLPDSIRFWKIRIEEADADQTFAVGLIYGPSGCGKSSLMKAALLPRLSPEVIPVYVECTGQETELRLLKGLRKRCPSLPQNLDLTQTLVALRRLHGIPAGKKVLIVLDQFEQWLHAQAEVEHGELVQTLRQCDGGQVQCIVMVRDDFWLAVSRFMRELEIRLLEGHNSALVDLFDTDHARRVLAAFGRAYGRLPENPNDRIAAQQKFLDQAIRDLAQDGKVICVRLSLFAELMKGKSWAPGVLAQAGGTEGVGEAFLQETFSESTSPPEHRLHAAAACKVLRALLPESGTNIRGHMRTHAELLDASDYARRPQDFEDLLNILDRELRLITPTDPEGIARDEDASASAVPGQKHYQLTHDYLVHSLRQWLTRKQRETRRGRAELRLAERAAAWTAKPEKRHLPARWEYLNIRWLVSRKQWTESQQEMMQTAGRFHGIRAGVLLILLALLGWAAYELNGSLQAAVLVNSLRTAKEDAVLGVIDQLGPYRRWADGRLRSLLLAEVQTAEDQRAGLHAQMALLAIEPDLAEELKDRLLDPATAYSYVGVLRELLQPHQARFRAGLWEILRATEERPERRFHAGLALAGYEPASDRWSEADHRFLAEQLVAANPEHQPRLREYLRPIGESLLVPLEVLFRNHDLSETQQLGAANALADFAAQDGQRLADLLTVATAAQYRIVYNRFERLGISGGRNELLHLVQTEPADELSSLDRILYGQRRAGAAITLLRQGLVDQMFAALRVGADPESLTQFVHRCRSREVSPQELLRALDAADKLRQTKKGDERKREDRVLFGLLLALGEYLLEELPGAARQPLINRLAAWYAHDPSSAIHGATGWLLRHWNQGELARQVDETPVAYSPEREWFVKEIKYRKVDGLWGGIPGAADMTPDQWAKTLLGGKEASMYFTFIAFPAGQYEIGSLEDEPEREFNEVVRRRVRLMRGFAISDRSVTWSQFDAFDGGDRRKAIMRGYDLELADDDPAIAVNWFDSVAYCRWLTLQSGLLESDQAYDGQPSGGKQDEITGFAELSETSEWPVRLGAAGFRLPIEAEWEVACRGGTLTAYSFGGDARLLSHYGWYLENAGRWSQPVGLLRPNPRGLLDMHGNVFDWCHDWSGAESRGEAVDPVGPERGSFRVYRGGCWYSLARFCRSANEGGGSPGARFHYLGFRVARSSVE